MNHIAVVPVGAVGDLSRHALDYASRVAPRVLAVHVRNGQPMDVQADWEAQARDVPLVVLETSDHDWKSALVGVLRHIKKKERPDLITVVVPRSSAGALRRSLLLTRGVSVRPLPV
jgi:hypothetical protein